MPTLAHFSDVHLAPMPTPWPTQLLNQRIFGFLNWHLFGRKRHHQRSALDALMAHLLTQTYDHIALTGDIVNVALPQEFAASVPWLTTIGRPDEISVVPGNHDAYTAISMTRGMGTWMPYMRSNAAGAAYAHSLDDVPYTGFPYVRLIGEMALIGVASGIPTRPLAATGTLGEAQLAALDATLAALETTDLCKVLMIHHPPLPGLAVPLRDLTDALELEALLARYQIHLALHGHNHRNELAWGQGPQAPFPVVGVASASMAGDGHVPLSRYNLYDLQRHGTGWAVQMRGYAPRKTGGTIDLVEDADLTALPVSGAKPHSDATVQTSAAWR